MMRGSLALVAALALSACSLSYQRCHRSPLIALHLSSDVKGRELKEVCRHASFYEDMIIKMADDFEVPLQSVIPVQVYHEAAATSGRSYYSRLTRAIVLSGEADPATFVHELSHLYAHRLSRSPPYWADQALAEYMETRFVGEKVRDRTRWLALRMAEARDSGEVLAHLTRTAVDEERGWGFMVVRYLFEERWADAPLPERIRGLFQLSEEDVAELAPDLLSYCRRPELLAEARPPSR